MVISPRGIAARHQVRLLRRAGLRCPVATVRRHQVAAAVASADREVVLVLDGLLPHPAAAFTDLVDALRHEPGIGAASCPVTHAGRQIDGGRRFSLQAGVPVPVPVVATAGHEPVATVGGAAVAMRIAGLGEGVSTDRYRGRSWALEAGMLLREAGLEVVAVSGHLRGLPEDPDAEAADACSFIGACGAAAFRLVARDMVQCRRVCAAERLQVWIEPPARSGLADACRRAGWALVGDPDRAHLVLATSAGGGTTAWWTGRTERGATEQRRLGGRIPGRDFAGDGLADLRDAVVASLGQPSFALRLGARDSTAATRWGEYALAQSLKRGLHARGAAAVVVAADDDRNPYPACFDVAMHFRGRGPGPARPGQFNLAWLISHPDEVSDAELERYDGVLVASSSYAEELAGLLRAPVRELLQFTDVASFHPEPDPSVAADVLFVGNWRSVFRHVVWDAICVGRTPAVYGEGWQYLLPERCRGTRVETPELRRLYSSCGVLLNDHWDDMREHGFVSNRIFDALACGAYVVSDDSESVSELFHGLVPTYRSLSELRDAIDRGLQDGDHRREVAEAGRALVMARHTSGHRADELLALVRQLAGSCSRSAVTALGLTAPSRHAERPTPAP